MLNVSALEQTRMTIYHWRLLHIYTKQRQVEPISDIPLKIYVLHQNSFLSWKLITQLLNLMSDYKSSCQCCHHLPMSPSSYFKSIIKFYIQSCDQINFWEVYRLVWWNWKMLDISIQDPISHPLLSTTYLPWETRNTFKCTLSHSYAALANNTLLLLRNAAIYALQSLLYT